MAMRVHFQKDVFEKDSEPAGRVTFAYWKGKDFHHPNIEVRFGPNEGKNVCFGDSLKSCDQAK